MSEFNSISTSRSRGAAERETAAERLLAQVVDCGLVGIPLLAPWFMGGRHPLGELVIVLLAVVVALAWLGGRALAPRPGTWTRSPAEWVLLGAILLVVAQLIPWPQAILDLLSPHTRALLPLWRGDASVAGTLGTWSQVSMTPEWTRAALTLLLAYGMLFVVAVQRLKTVADVAWMLRWIAGAVAVQALFGIVQYLASNGKFVWIYQHPFRDTYWSVTGSFINKNHFAHLMALGLGPLVCLVAASLKRSPSADRFSLDGRADADGSRQLKLLLWMLGLIIVVLAGLMTLSRGGAMAMAVTTAICVGALLRAGMLSWRFAAASAGVAALVVVSLTIHGFQQVVERLDDYTSVSVEQLDHEGGRRAIWNADSVALKDYWSFGSGVGSHREIYPMYLTRAWETEFTHAENGYLQVALETGLPGLALLAAGIVLCGVWCYRSLIRQNDRRTYLYAVAIAGSLAASVIHSFVDFVWYISSLMAITTLLAACAYRLSLVSRGEEAAGGARMAWSPWQWRVAPLAVALLGVWMSYDRFCAAMAEPYWDQFLSYALKASDGGDTPPADGSVVGALENVLRWTPDNGKAHVRLASLLLGRFEQLQQTAANSLPLNQVSEAAMASREHFHSKQDMDAWLDRAIGGNRRLLAAALWHLERGMAQCALQGEGYIHLADLCFLKGQGQAERLAYLNQALQVRPYDGVVLLAAGSAAALRGDVDAMITYWRPVLQCRDQERKAMVGLLTSMPIPLADVLTAFQPNLRATRELFWRYSETTPHDQLGPLYAYYSQMLNKAMEGLDEEQAASLWGEMANIYAQSGQPDVAIQCLEKAVAGRPTDFEIRLLLGMRLNEMKRFAEARKQLEWCAERRPGYAPVKEHLAKAVRGQLDQQGEATATASTGTLQN